MIYTANFETAKIYIKTGLKKRAKEYLEKVLRAVPEAEREASNGVYLKSLFLLARLHLEDGDRKGSADYIDRGLAVKPDHADLLFLKALLLWDIARHDEMFLNLMAYLGAVIAADAGRYDYEYNGESVVAEAIYKLIPEAYTKAAARHQLADAIAEAASRSENSMIQTVHRILQDVDNHGKKEAGIADAR